MKSAQMRLLPHWHDATEAEIASFLALTTERWHTAGTVLVAPGMPAGAAQLIVDGEVQLTLEYSDMAFPLQVLGAGDWLGVASLADGAAELFCARAIAGVRLLHISSQGLAQLWSAPSALAMRVQRSHIESTLDTATRLAPLVRAVQRLAQLNRNPGPADLAALGFARLAAAVQRPSRPDSAHDIEVVKHEGAPIAANFRSIR